jgi:hypothetical protein
MPLFGPRLDSPSAIGDEGRPRATSLTVGSLLTFCLFGATAFYLGFPGLVVAIAGLTGFVTLGIALLNRERVLTVFIGQLTYALGTLGLTGLVGYLTVFRFSMGLYLGGFALALIGLSTAWANVGETKPSQTAIMSSGYSYFAMLGSILLGIIMIVVGWIIWWVLPGGNGVVRPIIAVARASAAISIAGLVWYFAARRLPVVPLVPRSQRATAQRYYRTARRTLALVAACALLVAVLVLIISGITPTIGVPPGQLLPTAVTVVGSQLAIVAVLGLAALGVLLILLLSLLRRVTAQTGAKSNRRLAGLIAGFAFALLLVPSLLGYVPLPGSMAILGAITLLFFGPLCVIAVEGTFVGAVEFSLLPDRAGGLALASGGLIIAAVASAMLGIPTPLVIACAVGAMVTWDVTEYGLSLTAEVGHLPETRPLELVHALVSVGLGVGLVVLLSGIDLLRTTVATSASSTPGMILAGLGALLVIAAVRF